MLLREGPLGKGVNSTVFRSRVPLFSDLGCVTFKVYLGPGLGILQLVQNGGLKHGGGENVLLLQLINYAK